MLTISDCTFYSHHHISYSAIAGNNCTLNLSGVVYFINNTIGDDHHGLECGAAIYLNSGDDMYVDAPHSILNVNRGASVHFINNTAIGCAGALQLKSTEMDVGNNVNMTFIGNKIIYRDSSYARGGAIVLSHSSIKVRTNASIQLSDNSGSYGGAIELLFRSSIHLYMNATIYFINNTAKISGGAIRMTSSNINITNATLYFINNSAQSEAGGAISMSDGIISIYEHANVSFINNTAAVQGGAIYTAAVGDISTNMHSSLTFHNNSANQGGALFLSSGSVYVNNDSFIQFVNNSATLYGGAIYFHNQFDLPCFLVLKDYSSALLFKGNSAKSGVGMHIYGASIRSTACMNKCNTLPYCGKDLTTNNITFIPNLHSSLSPVSSDPKRVCLCGLNGKPQCADLSSIFNNLRVYPGETFNVSVVVVGYDFGVSTGAIHADFIIQPNQYNDTPRLHPDQDCQMIRNGTQCSNISYNIYSARGYVILRLRTLITAVNSYGNESSINMSILSYNHNHHSCLGTDLLTTPLFLNITLLTGCPPGYTRQEQSHGLGCSCYAVLKSFNFSCILTNNIGYLRWNSTVWVGIIKDKTDGIKYNQYCPLDYCKPGEKRVDLGTDPDAQCAFNHAGVLCGGCKKNYSLAIGSSRCIMCSDDNYLTLLIVFAVAGFLFVIFILALNLTVTQGLINGLIFYANITWAYKGILFPAEQQNVMLYFQIFIAWLNLDFGIETCFFVGLKTFWKTWLQFLFPLYIWIIGGVIIITCRYSSRLTNLIGDRAVPLLATLFLLSYMKLLRTAVTALEFAVLTHYPDNSKIIVWYLDGNLPFCKQPHIYLFIVSVATLIFLCLPFTLFLLLIQYWRKISHLRLLKWTNKLTPVYDAYFAPLKDKHHYWFGVLLLIRGILLVIFTLTSANSPTINLLVLSITMALLLFYMSLKNVYKHKISRILESVSVMNLIVLSCAILYAPQKKTIILELSIGFVFVQFCIIVLVSFIKRCYNTRCRYLQRKSNGYNLIDEDSDEMFHERIEDSEISAEEMIYHVRSTTDTY